MSRPNRFEPFLAGAAVVACCGVSGLIAGGILGVVGAFLTRWWPILLPSALIFVVAEYGYIARHRGRRKDLANASFNGVTKRYRQ